MTDTNVNDGAASELFVTNGEAPSENAKRIKRWFDMLAEGDIDGIKDSGILDENLVIKESPSISFGGEFHGYEGFFGQYLGLIVESGFSMEIVDQRFLDCGEVVVSDMTVVFKADKTGNEFPMPYLEKFVMREGRVVEITPHPHDSMPLVEWMTSETRGPRG